MSFKTLNDRSRQNALVPFLTAANHISGIAVTMAIRKSVRRFCSDEAFFQLSRKELALDRQMKHRAFEQMLRIVHLVSMLVGGLSKPGQNVYWISDQDELFANDRRAQSVKQIADRFTSYYVEHGMGEIGIGTTVIDEADRADEDLNAIPDLMAGAVAEMLTEVARQQGGGISPLVAVPVRTTVSPKTDIIFDWISDNQYSLQRAVILVEPHHQHGFSVSKLVCTS